MDGMMDQPSLEDVDLAQILRALSDPQRLNITRTLLVHGGEHACHEFGEGLSRATMSHHYRTLRLAGLISTRVDGRRRFIALRTEELDTRFPGLLQLLRSS